MQSLSLKAANIIDFIITAWIWPGIKISPSLVLRDSSSGEVSAL